MKSITDALAAHLAGDTTTTARLWKIKRKATTQVSSAVAYVAGPNYSDPSCDQAQIGTDWEFVNGQWRTSPTAAPNAETGWLYAYNFGFQIPATATIIGIVCQATYSADAPTSGFIQEVSLFNAGSPPSTLGTEKTPQLQFTPSQQTMLLGSRTDMWGLPTSTLNPALVNSSTFGFGIRAYSDGVRLYVSQFAVTVYYTMPAGGLSNASKLVMLSTLTKHTNWTGDAEDDLSADARSCNYGAGLVFDTNGTFYINNIYSEVRKFDGATGALLGTLGTMTYGAGVGLPGGGGFRIMNHPTRGKWLIYCRAPVYGAFFQAMAIDAKDAAGSPIAPGTITNALVTMYDGVSSGGNNGGWDVDANGNIWLFGHNDPGHGSAAVLIQVEFTGDTSLGIISSTDFEALYGWTGVGGALVDPLTQTIVVSGADATGNNISRYDPVAGSFLATNRSLGTAVPVNMGADGNFVIASSSSLTIQKVRASDLSVLQTETPATYGITTAIKFNWYDAVNNFVWIIFADPGGGYSVKVCDLTNPGAYASLSDPSQTADPLDVCYQGATCSPDGGYFATQSEGGTPDHAFIDFWGIALPSAGGVVASTINMGFADRDQDVTL